MMNTHTDTIGESLITKDDLKQHDIEERMQRAEMFCEARKQAKAEIMKKTFKQYYSLRIALGIYDDLPEIKTYAEDVKKLKKLLKEQNECGLFVTINMDDKNIIDENDEIKFDELKNRIDKLKEILNSFDNSTSWSFCLEQRSEDVSEFFGFHFHIYIKGEFDETPYKYAEYFFREKRCKPWVGDIAKIDVKKVKKGSKREEMLQRYYMMGIKTKEKKAKSDNDKFLRQEMAQELDDNEYGVILYKSI